MRGLILGMTLLAAAGPATASAAAPSEAIYLFESGQPERARAAAEERLVADPGDLEAHWIRIHADRSADLGARRLRYRSWWEEDPEDEVRRAAYVDALGIGRFGSAVGEPEPGWCLELERAASVRPRAAYARYVVLRALHESSKTCEFDAPALVEEMREVTDPRAIRWLIAADWKSFDEELGERVVHFAREFGGWTGALSWVFSQKVQGAGVRHAREALRRQIPKLAASKAPGDLLAAAKLLEADGDADAAAAVRARASAFSPIERDAAPILIASRLPDLEVRNRAGEPVLLSSIAGPWVLDLWGTWYAPCVKALPHLQQLAERYAGRVEFVALAVGDTAESVDRFFAGATPAYTVLVGPPETLETLGVGGVPSTFFVAADGTVKAFQIGWSESIGREADANVEALLEE